jgi:hypothetical protein
MAQAVTLRRRMRWKEARVLLEQAREPVAEAADDALAEKLVQAEADLDLARELDEVREQGHAIEDGKWEPWRVKHRYG